MKLRNLLKPESEHKRSIRKMQLEQKIVEGIADAELRGETGAFVNTGELDIVEEVSNQFKQLPGHYVSLCPNTGYKGTNLIRLPTVTVFIHWGKE